MAERRKCELLEASATGKGSCMTPKSDNERHWMRQRRRSRKSSIESIGLDYVSEGDMTATVLSDLSTDSCADLSSPDENSEEEVDVRRELPLSDEYEENAAATIAC